MISTVFHDPKQNFKWVDVTYPTNEEYKELETTYKLHPAAVKDCLSPNHLPKFEKFGDVMFMITRVYDVSSKQEADNIQTLTNKIAIFVSDKFLITIHRKDEPFLVEMKKRWKNYESIPGHSGPYLFNQLLYRIIKTYVEMLTQATLYLDEKERKVFDGAKGQNVIREMYQIKRRASIFKRMIFLTKDVIYKFAKFTHADDPFTQDLIETVDAAHFAADELHENTNNLLNLHISLSAHRSDEVLSGLSIVSFIFLPLTFITGLYGMNFENMPELHWHYGYFMVLSLIFIIITVAIMFFKKKGWL